MKTSQADNQVKGSPDLKIESNDASLLLIRKLDQTCSHITRELWREKIDQNVLVQKLSSEKSEHEQLKKKIMSWKDELERQQQLLHPVCSSRKMQIRSLHYELRHKMNNLAEERIILRQLEKVKVEVRVSMEALKHSFCHLHDKERIQSCIKYMESVMQDLSKEELAKRYKINRVKEEKDTSDKRIRFLEKKLARIYKRIEVECQTSKSN